MLQKIGKRTKTVLGILMLVPIIGSFLVWGIGDMLRASGVSRYAAVVGNVTIPEQDFRRAYAREIDGMRREGIKVDTETAKTLGIAKSVLRNLIRRELLLQAARDNGIVIGDRLVAQEIQKEKVFRDDNGKFSRERFKAVLQNSGVGEQEFINGVRGDLAIKILLGAVQLAAQPPQDLPRALYMLQKSTYTADVYALPHDAVQNAPAPPESDIQKYYDAHQDRYRRPEMRRATMAVLPLATWQASLQPSDAELKTLYKSRVADFSIPEERSAQFVVLPNQDMAQKVADRARGGEKLLAAASAVTGTNAPLKTMTGVKPGTLPSDVDKALFKLPRGETSEPVNTPLGWYVMQITYIKSGITPLLAQVKDKLVAAWRADQASVILPKFLNKIDDSIAGGASLEEIAKTYGLQLRQLPLLDANGRGMDDKTSADASMKATLAVMFKQNSGEVGNVYQLANGDYAVLRIDETKASAVPPLTEMHDRVVADWQKTNQRHLAEEMMGKLANSWRTKDDVAGAAEKIGAVMTTHSDISRAATEETHKPVPPLDQAILRTGAVGDVVTSTDGATEYVAKIRAITTPVPASITDAALADVRNTATQWVQSDDVQLFLDALEKRYAVEINDKAIKEIESGAN